jgi:hypothetical protein
MISRRHRMAALFTACAFAVFVTRPAAAAPSVNLRAEGPAKIQELTATADIFIGGHSGTAELWNDVCAAPCGFATRPGVKLRVAVDGAPASAPFLPAPDRDLTVSVKPGSPNKLAAGLGLTLLGIGAVLTGSAMLAASASMEPPTSGPFAGADFASFNAQAADRAGTLRAVGLTSLVAGALGLLVGIPLAAANRPQVTFD